MTVFGNLGVATTKLLKSIATGAMATLTMKKRALISVALIMALYRVRITHGTREALYSTSVLQPQLFLFYFWTFWLLQNCAKGVGWL